MLLYQNDPFRELDTLFDRMTGRNRSSGNNTMPMDAYRRDSDVWVHLDLPGVSAESIDISLERNVLTVTAERSWDRKEEDQFYVLERPAGSFTRQVHLGDSLDGEAIEADYHDGVLTLRIPIAEKAQPRKISIKSGGEQAAIDVESSS